MSYYLTDEIVESLKEYAARVEKFYHERQICHFDWKPARISVDRIHPNKVLFDMVYLDDESLMGCVSVEDLVTYTGPISDARHSLIFSIWEYCPYTGNANVHFVMPYHDDVCDSIGQYIYSFVDEIDTLIRCYQESNRYI